MSSIVKLGDTELRIRHFNNKLKATLIASQHGDGAFAVDSFQRPGDWWTVCREPGEGPGEGRFKRYLRANGKIV